MNKYNHRVEDCNSYPYRTFRINDKVETKDGKTHTIVSIWSVGSQINREYYYSRVPLSSEEVKFGMIKNIKGLVQTRLEKVLSKFSIDENNGYCYENNNIWIEYNYIPHNDNKFRMGLYPSRVVSLETVESLLKDLEEE